MFETIAAIATPLGRGGVAIVRVSGRSAVKIAETVCFLENQQTVAAIPPRNIFRATFKNIKGEFLDEGLVLKMLAPNSFTGEDVIEIHCHGGSMPPKMILKELIKSGARLAEPGEFTRRAFLNGKMDLTRAEAVADVIDAETENSLYVAARQLDGLLADSINAIRDSLLSAASHILALLDYPEEGVEDFPYATLADLLHDAKNKIEELLSTAPSGRILRDGYNIALIGSANVGKSSLLNAILGDDRAIVTDIAGTTRDVLKERANINGYLINLWDTAGIRETTDKVESIGVKKSLESLKTADLILVVIDGSRPPESDDLNILEMTKNFHRIILLNKCDLTRKYTHSEGHHISAKNFTGMPRLFDMIAKEFENLTPKDRPMITNPRQEAVLASALGSLIEAETSLEQHAPVDIILGDIELSIAALGKATGKSVSDEIVDGIFSRFCVGK